MLSDGQLEADTVSLNNCSGELWNSKKQKMIFFWRIIILLKFP